MHMASYGRPYYLLFWAAVLLAAPLATQVDGDIAKSLPRRCGCRRVLRAAHHCSRSVDGNRPDARGKAMALHSAGVLWQAGGAFFPRSLNLRLRGGRSSVRHAPLSAQATTATETETCMHDVPGSGRGGIGADTREWFLSDYFKTTSSWGGDAVSPEISVELAIQI
jgi:hypothetical protein